MRRGLWLSVAGLLWLVPLSAGAEVTLPDGQVVPQDSGSEVQLYTLFANQGEAIDWIADAHDLPDTFSPLCGFTATLLLHEAGANLGVAWYNVIDNATLAPSALELYEVVAPFAPIGSVVTGASIRQDPRYLGGAIGFALIRIPAHFTESKWNTVCDQGPCAATPGPWILGLSYQSVNMPNSYYIAFEDGNTSSSGWNNDGDYNDFVFLFTGIACAGAGEPCAVDGAQGVCLDGLTECDAQGALYCKQLNQPTAELCDGVDNDCNGELDEGDELCEPGETCVRGTCVPWCGEEFPCLGGDVCEGTVCVHPDCVGVECMEGEACIEGECRAPCDGLVCPGGQVCRVGRCVDACAGVQCDADRVCDDGVCVLNCTCQGCESSSVCNETTGLCVEPGCETVVCDGATHCVAGQCVDACEGAICPNGQACSDGSCLDTEPAAAAVQDGGQLNIPDPVDNAGISTDAVADAGGGAGPDSKRNLLPEQSGCACRAATGTDSAPAMLGLLLLAGSLAARRRRRVAGQQDVSRAASKSW